MIVASNLGDDVVKVVPVYLMECVVKRTGDVQCSVNGNGSVGKFTNQVKR